MQDASVAEVVYLFVDGQIAAELTFSEFEQHVDRQTEIPGAPLAGSVCRAGFVVVGPELVIEGLVFFLLQIDDRGRPDRNFNVPLSYLAQNAGPGPDLGAGPVPMACRGSCSVPWHANNLWDPTLDETVSPLPALTAAIARNALALNPVRSTEPETDEAALVTSDVVEELSARHMEQLIELQQHHESELTDLRAVLEAKLELYRCEVARLKGELQRSAQSRDGANDRSGDSDQFFGSTNRGVAP